MIDIFDRLAQWLPALGTLLTLANFLYLMFLHSKFVSKPDHEQYCEKIDRRFAVINGKIEGVKKEQVAADLLSQSQTMKITYIEKAIDKLPSSEKLHELSLQLRDFKGDMKEVDAKLEAVDKLGDRLQLQVDRIEEFMKATS